MIPTNTIRIDDTDGTTSRLNTNFLNPDEKETNHFSSYYTTESKDCEQVKLKEHHQEVTDPKQCNNRKLKTSLGKALKVVLGHTEEVQSLDNQHYKL